MNMRTSFRFGGLFCGLVVGVLALSASRADAAVTRVITSGTTANLNLVSSVPGARPDCTIDVWVTLMASTSVQRTDNTKSTGAIGFVQRVDNCTDEFEFGSFNASLPSTAFTTATGSAALKATIPVTFEVFSPDGGTVTRNLVATLQYKNIENNSDASRSFGIVSAPGLVLITKSNSIFNAASITGQLMLDAKNLVTPTASVDSGIETASSATIDITK
jgi:hypothetical protein